MAPARPVACGEPPAPQEFRADPFPAVADEVDHSVRQGGQPDVDRDDFRAATGHLLDDHGVQAVGVHPVSVPGGRVTRL